MREQKQKDLNVFLVGLSFLLLFTAFQTVGNTQAVIIDNAKNNGSLGYVDGYHGDGFWRYLRDI